MEHFPVNALEINENFSLPYDEVERGLNTLQAKAYPKRAGAIIKSFLALLEKSRRVLFQHHDLKQGLIYKNLAELYLSQGKIEYGRYFLEVAGELLMNYQGLYTDIQEKLNDL